jgi:hypothetical protein
LLLFLPEIATFSEFHAETPWIDPVYQQQIVNTIESILGQKWKQNEEIKRNPYYEHKYSENYPARVPNAARNFARN